VIAVPRRLLLVSVAACCVGCDQVTKAIASAALPNGTSVSYLHDTVRLSYAENPGAFLSFGADLSAPMRLALFGGMAAVVIIVFGRAALRGRTANPLKLVAMAMIIAGAVGNLIDRVAFGAVRDFLNLGIGTVRTGIFNVADVAITTGVVVLCIGILARPPVEPSGDTPHG
jgi:signal peptidase II